MKQVRAKFLCHNIEHSKGSDPNYAYAMVTMLPVYGGGANESWSKATPGGQITMTITNMEAVEAFETGKEYFVDFTPAN